MGTPLQEVYDSFFVKTEHEDFTYKQDLVYQYFKEAIAYCYKTVSDNLNYVLDNNKIMLSINSSAVKNGNVSIVINNIPNTISILSTDSLINIADKIKTVLVTNYVINTDYSNVYPILYISKSDLSSIVASYIDTDVTGISITVDNTYDGSFNNTIGQDTIELIALCMKREYYRKIVAKFEGLKTRLGTKDFNRLDNEVNEYKAAIIGFQTINDEISAFKQEFYYTD